MGCGDVGLRVKRLLAARIQVFALTSSPHRCELLRSNGITPLAGNLDTPATLQRMAGIATRVLYLAPPAAHGTTDHRTTEMTQALRKRSRPTVFVYGSTSGVYGDCGGRWVDETHHVQPQTPRAQRRQDAESTVRFLGRSAGVRSSVLRIPGIYAPDREGGTPRDRLARNTPVLAPEDDVFTNHIHASDLARACICALWRGKAQRVYNVCDDTVMKMGDYFDLAADLYGVARPPRMSLSKAKVELPDTLLSFMQESRRLVNRRLKAELRLRLRYATVTSGLAAEP